MGVPAPKRPAEYRDDPDAVSLHTTPDDYAYDDAPDVPLLPPSYSESTVQSGPALAPTPYDGDWAVRPATDLEEPADGIVVYYNWDHDKGYHLSKGVPQITETQDLLEPGPLSDNDPAAFQHRLNDLARVPPRPLVYILGTHKEKRRNKDGKMEEHGIIDFRLVLQLKSFLAPLVAYYSHAVVANSEKTYRGGFMKKRAPGYKQDVEIGEEDPPTWKDWCEQYCASPSPHRIFRLRHEVVGLDTDYLRKRIEGLIRGTNYRGHLSITFPIEDAKIDLYTSSRVNKWRLNKWIRRFFYLTFLWIFAWPYLFFATKRWDVVRTKWHYSRENEDGIKSYATVSEEQWFERWHVGIRRLVLDRYEGVVHYPHLQGVMDRPNDPPNPGALNVSVNTGNSRVDGALGLLQTGIQVAGIMTRGDPMAGLQGGWGYDC